MATISILLTFDSGPHGRGDNNNRTTSIVQSLNTMGYCGVFFIQTHSNIKGRPIRCNSEGGKEAICRALPQHVIQLQTGSDDDYALHTNRTPEKLKAELQRGIDVIKGLPGGTTPEFIRSPRSFERNKTARNEQVNQVYRDLSLSHVGSNVDPDDRLENKSKKGRQATLTQRRDEVLAEIDKQVRASIARGVRALVVRLRDTSPVTEKYLHDIITKIHTTVSSLGVTPDFVSTKTKALQELRSWREYNRTQALAFARARWDKVCPDGAIACRISKQVQMANGTTKENFGTDFKTGLELATTFSAHPALGHPGEVATRPGGAGQILSPATQVISPNEEWTTTFDDCTHFVSSCLGRPREPAGGLDVGSDYNTCYGRLSAHNTIEFLRKNGMVRTLRRTGQGDNLHLLPTTFPFPQPIGDTERLFGQLEPGDLIGYWSEEEGRYVHFVLYGEHGRILCHTFSRTDQIDLPENKWHLWKNNGKMRWSFFKVEER